MSSDHKSPKRGLAIVEMLSTQENKDLAIKYRKLDGYPVDGFFNRDDYGRFPKKKRKGLSGYYMNFYKEVLASNPKLKDTLDNPDYFFVLFDFYRFGTLTPENKAILNDTGCDWVFVDASSRDDTLKRLKNGVYMKISIDSKIEHIKKFLDRPDKRDLFKYLTELVRSKGGFGPKLGKIVKSSTTSRDLEIIRLSKRSVKGLSILSGLGKGKRRDDHISKIMEKRGYKISPGSIRKIISRKKNRVHEM